MLPWTLVKSVSASVQLFVYVLWSELVEGETVVQAEWKKRG